MKFRISLLAILASLVAMIHAIPVPIQDNQAIPPVKHSKRIPCPPASEKAASEEYKRNTAMEGDEDALGDDSPALIVACNF
ncbi:hypothetical protein GGS26DRAFT_596576 [Hypomontagnella submonticulosa]|nr:hypothetical protein GGS26DRAFT_596576 [Hypomontagnella submonticulosa]